MAKPYWKLAYTLGGTALVAAYIHAAPSPTAQTASLAHPTELTLEKIAAKQPDQAEVTCLAQAIYFEARGESEEGRRAVGNVVLNRVADPHYPKSVCGVVFQNEHARNKCQFSFACDGLADDPPDTRAWHSAQKLAETMMTHKRKDDTGHATHYHAVYVTPVWASALQETVDIGHHIFYREDRGHGQARTDVAAAAPQS
jgi:spore germination cell wall hydrolase CwlJ-like protein